MESEKDFKLLSPNPSLLPPVHYQDRLQDVGEEGAGVMVIGNVLTAGCVVLQIWMVTKPRSNTEKWYGVVESPRGCQIVVTTTILGNMKTLLRQRGGQ